MNEARPIRHAEGPAMHQTATGNRHLFSASMLSSARKPFCSAVHLRAGGSETSGHASATGCTSYRSNPTLKPRGTTCEHVLLGIQPASGSPPALNRDRAYFQRTNSVITRGRYAGYVATRRGAVFPADLAVSR